ncbi:MAG: type II toxin-antitoxin system VapC family toxin, partial [Nitrospirae bacterium]|nr:type II toxin-antitoxin system VapC family toxin [Nitrospirota bacterium]
IVNSRLLMTDALSIAHESRRSFYDSLYLALAKTSGCRMVTADLKLYNALKHGPLKKTILWIEDV